MLTFPDGSCSQAKGSQKGLQEDTGKPQTFDCRVTGLTQSVVWKCAFLKLKALLISQQVKLLWNLGGSFIFYAKRYQRSHSYGSCGADTRQMQGQPVKLMTNAKDQPLQPRMTVAKGRPSLKGPTSGILKRLKTHSPHAMLQMPIFSVVGHGTDETRGRQRQ